MNKIYRRLWSTARQCWVVASELTRRKGRSAGSTNAALLVSVLLGSVSTNASAARFYGCDSAAVGAVYCVPIAGQEDVANASSSLRSFHHLSIGGGAWTDGSYSTSFGNRTSAEGDKNSLLGYGAVATQGYASVFGAHAVGDGIGTVAFGHDAKAYTENSIAVGSGSRTNEGAGVSKIAIGGDAYAGTSGWTGSIALGGKARAEYDSLAMGYEARATASGAVAIGRGSVASERNTVSVGNGNTKRRIVNVDDARLNATSTDAVTGKQLYQLSTATNGLISQTSTGGTVRIGAENTGPTLTISNKSGAARYLNGVRNGALNATSTDAVTGQQLFATNQNVTAATNRINAKALSLGEGATAESVAYGVSTALGHNAKSYNGQSVAVGFDARAGVDAAGNKVDNLNAGVSLGSRSRSGNGAVAAGLQASAVGDRAIAIGHEASADVIHATAIGFQSKASAGQATALGRGTQASASYSTAMGNLAHASAESAVAIGDRSLAQHNGSVALGNGSQTSAAHQISVGSASIKRKLVNLADGALTASSTEAVTGKQLNATNTNVTTAQNAANTAQVTATGAKTAADSALAKANALAGLVSQVSATGNVRLGSENTGTVLDVRNKANASRSISGVTDATLSSSSTEAVTGRQLTATNSNVTTAQNTANAAQTTATAARTTADNALGMATALSGLVSQVSATGNMRLGADNAGTVVDVANKDGAKRRVNNVANGVLSSSSTDVVTGQQLHATNQSVSTQGQSLVLHGQQLAAHTQSLAEQGQRVATNRADIDQLRTDVDNFDPDLGGVVKFSADRLLVDMEGARVSGVAAGDVSSAASTDAVNGGQLFAANERIAAIESDGRFLSVGTDSLSEAARSGSFGVAIGDSAQASTDHEGGTAVGAFAVAGGKNSVALGRGALVEKGAEGSFALGTGSRVAGVEATAIGANSRAESSAVRAVAVGAGSVARESDTVSFGTDVYQRRLVNVGRGIGKGDVSTIAQLEEALAALGGGSGLDGSGSVIAPTYSVQGGTQNNVGEALAVLDGAVIKAGSRVDGVESQLRATFQQSPSISTDGIGQLNLAGTQGMVLSNLADGHIAAGSRDAVTGSQLYAAKQDIARNRSDLETLLDANVSRVAPAAKANSVIDFGGAKLIGVSDGELSAESREVVSGSQLHATNSKIEKMEGHAEMFAVGSEVNRERAEAGIYGVAVGNGAQASMGSEGGTAVGSYTSALGKNSVALGRGAYVSSFAENGYALGAGSSVDQRDGVALGSYALVTEGAMESVALGAYSFAGEGRVVSFGNASLKRRLTNVANGVAQHDAATIGQLRGALSTLGGNIDANGNVTSPGFNVQGQRQNTVNEALATLDSAVVTTGSRVDRVETQLRAVFQESPSIRSDGTAQLTLAGANGMVISNVANGLIAAGSREAVNGGQLHAVQQQLNGRIDGLEQRVDGQPQARAMVTASAAPTEEIMPSPEASGSPQVASAGEGASPAPQPKSKKDDSPAPTPQVDTAELEKMLARANEYTDGAISNFERRLDKMDKRFNRMAAMSSAQTAMAMNTAGLATYNRLGAGVGYAEGESAMAVGYQRVLNDKGSATFSLNGAFTNSGERSMGVGVGIGW
ncbi:ESPR-type extended signal peptide-containing protein [Stenotrophomonas indicatrix]|uniref:ESPR-type extended signal peptide-containing protein n=1 Tax=Stenotrophomonas indicatrix TaxID=2045451 RepID=UPI0028E1FF16|nr:ESPR-type extended signal peptide-containing protein [Stenotrophomonas indicatrix]MDT9582590.1 ESPR-type extended signal peptide-containing protein [Stenotrophomonas indicatrix]